MEKEEEVVVKKGVRTAVNIFAVFTIIVFLFSSYLFISFTFFVKDKTIPEGELGVLYVIERSNPLELFSGKTYYRNNKIYGETCTDSSECFSCHTCGGDPINLKCVYIKSGISDSPDCSFPSVCDGNGNCVECVDNSNCKDSSKPNCVNRVCVPSFCGDGVCNNVETCKNCYNDCGKCPSEKGETYNITRAELFNGVSRILMEGDRIGFKDSLDRAHYLTLEKIKSATEIKSVDITISSSQQNSSLFMGEEKIFDVTQDILFRVIVKVNLITMKSANISIRGIEKENPIKQGSENNRQIENRQTTSEFGELQESPLNSKLIIFIISFSVIIIINILAVLIVLLYLKIRKISKNEKKSETPLKEPQKEDEIKKESNKKIEGLLLEGNTLLSKGDLTKAKEIYQKIKQNYNPFEDSDKKNYLKIYEFYKRIIKHEEKSKG